MRRRRILSAVLMCALLLQTQVSWAAAGEVWTSEEASSVEEASEESSIETQTPEEPSAEVQESEAPSAEVLSEGSSTEVQTIETPASTQVAAQALKAPSTGTNRQTVQGDETYLSDVDINIVTDGTVPLDSNDEAGNDSSLNNGIVRSFDTVTYEIEVAVNAYDPDATYEEETLYFEIFLPASEEEAVFEDMRQTYEGFDVEGINEGQIATGRVKLFPSDGNQFAVPGTQTFNIPIKVRAMGNGEVLIPTAKFWLKNNTTTGVCPEHGREEVVERSFPKVEISAALRLNVELRQATAVSTMTKGVFDFSQGNESALNKDRGEVYGQLFCYGITLQLYDPGSTHPVAKGLRGMELPEGDITLTIRLNSSFQLAGGQSYDADDPRLVEYQPLVYSLDENDTSSYINGDERALGTVTGKMVGNPSAYQAAPLNQGTNNNACENGGTWEVVNQTGNELTVKISGYSFNDLRFPAVPYGLSIENPGRYYVTGTKLEDIQVGCFSAGELWIVQPLENRDGILAAEDLGGNGNFSVTIEDTLLSANSVTGQSFGEQQNKTDDEVYYNVSTETGKGEITPEIHYAGRNEWNLAPDGKGTLWSNDVLGERAFIDNGQDYAVVGSETVGICGGFTSDEKGEDVNQVGAANTLIKFDGDALHLTSTYRLATEEYRGTAYWGYLSDGAGSQRNWESDAEMKDAKEWDLEWDTQYDSSKKYVAVLYETRTPLKMGKRTFQISFDTDVRDDFSLADNVYMICQTTRVWSVGQLERLGYLPEEIPSVIDPDFTGAYPEQDYGESMENSYNKAIYSSGKYVTSGNAQYGDSLYILPYISTINKSVVQTSGTGEQKEYYNFDNGERVADYVLIPQIEMGKDIVQLPGGAYTEVTIQDTLPEGMHYIPNSSYVGGTYVQAEQQGQQGTVEGGVRQEPEVTEQNGQTILTWVFPQALVEAGELDRIYYSCSLGNELEPEGDLQNGAQVTNQVSISTTEDQRDAAGYNRNLAERSVRIIRMRATSFTKVVEKELNELSNDINYQVIHNNNADTSLSSVVVDAMPYDGDESGSSFSGSYEVSEWQLDADRLGGAEQLTNFTLYYTEDTQYRDVILGDTTDPTAGTVSQDTITSQWKSLAINSSGNASFPSGVQPTAWALIGEIPGGRGVRVDLTLKQDTPSGGDILANRASEGHFYRSAKAYRVERSITGTAWLDENQNGGIDEQEEAFTGLSVILQQKVGGNWENAVDNSGQECRTETASDGTYSFTDLPAGTYRVLFEDGSNQDLKLEDYQMTIKEAPEIADSMNSKADGVTDSSSGKLTQAKIEEIELPALEDMVVSDYKVEYQNAGFILPNGSLTVSKTVGGLLGDKTREFEIDIEIEGLDGEVDCGDYGTVEFTDGKATVSLKHGESVTIPDLPVGTEYRVTEPEETREGYTVTYQGDAASGTIEGDKSVTVRNVKDYIPVSGIKFNMIPAALIVLIAGGISCFLIKKRCSRKRRRVHGRRR